MARAIILTVRHSDVRDTLARITAPTLVLHREDSEFCPSANGRYNRRAHPRSTLRPSCLAQMLSIGSATPRRCSTRSRSFVTGVRGGFGAERVLTTIMFTDIVGSNRARPGVLGPTTGGGDLLDNHDTIVRHETRSVLRTRSEHGRVTDSSQPSPARAPRSPAPTPSSTRSRVLGIEVRGGHPRRARVESARCRCRRDGGAHRGRASWPWRDPAKYWWSSTVRRQSSPGSRHRFAGGAVSTT